MKLVFCSDIHGNQYAFDSFLQDLKTIQPDKVIFMGDVFGYYYGQEMILNKLRSMEFDCLLGNHDKMYLDLICGGQDLNELCQRYGSSYYRSLTEISPKNQEFLRALPKEWHMNCDGLRIAAFHGSPADVLNGRIYPDTEITATDFCSYDYIFLGHTHHKMVRAIGSAKIVNPGSIGQQRDGKGCSYVVFDTAYRRVYFRIISYDISALLSEISEKDPDNLKLSEVLTRKC